MRTVLSLNIRLHTFTIDDGQPIRCDIVVAQSIYSSDIW